MPVRLPPPGASFVPSRPARIGNLVVEVGIATPASTGDGWWLALVWVADAEGIVELGALRRPGPDPPWPPMAQLGPTVAGALAGLIREDDERLAIRLAPAVPAADPTRAWSVPAVVRAGFGWEPARAATMTDAELAEAVVEAFVRAVEALPDA